MTASRGLRKSRKRIENISSFIKIIGTGLKALRPPSVIPHPAPPNTIDLTQSVHRPPGYANQLLISHANDDNSQPDLNGGDEPQSQPPAAIELSGLEDLSIEPSVPSSSSHSSVSEQSENDDDDPLPELPDAPPLSPPPVPALVILPGNWDLLIPNWLVLWSVYLSTGAGVLTEAQYILIRIIVTTAFQSPLLHWRAPPVTFENLNQVVLDRTRPAFPSYTTIFRKFRPRVLNFLCARTNSVPLTIQQLAPPTEDTPLVKSVDVVVPSQYALQDIATPIVWNYFESTAHDHSIPIVSERQFFTDCRSSISVDEDRTSVRSSFRARIQDIVDVHLENAPADMSRAAPFTRTDINGVNPFLRARILDIFGVQSFEKFTDPHGNDDVSSATSPAFLQYLDYTMNQDGADEQLVTKPGDIVASLQLLPVNSIGEEHEIVRILVIFRFWSTTDRNPRHCALLKSLLVSPMDSRLTPQHFPSIFDPIGTAPYPLTLYIRKLVLHENPGTQGARQNHVRIPTIGRLQNGENYFIYRFLLFHDGFNISVHNNKSSQGIYILPLNFGGHGRNTTNVGRVLTLTPPLVSHFSVFHHIMEDIQTGSTTGFLGFDANGQQRRIFLDLVGVFGDTPAINYGIDVLGHTATALCHQCTTRKAPHNGHPMLLANVASHGLRTAKARFRFRHDALYDCGADADCFNYLGIRRIVNLPRTPLDIITDILKQTRNQSPHDENGNTILPCIVDPYISSFITIDHLITGMVKNCLLLALSTITPAQRRFFEQKILTAIRLNKVCAIFRICNREKGLSKLTCSQVYSILPFLSVAFAHTIFDTHDAPPFSRRKTLCALDLLHNIAEVATVMWRTDLGGNYVYHVQRQVARHLAKIRALHMLERRDLKLLHRPNTHRLYEYAFHTLPLIGHASVTRELNMEKMHQALKRSVEKSNNKDSHLFAMRNNCVEDWKSRLGLLPLPLTMQRIGDVRSAHRLLSGNAQVANQTAQMPQQVLQLMNNVLIGPNLPPSAEIPAPSNVAPVTSRKMHDNILASSRSQAIAFTTASDIYLQLPEHAQFYIINNGQVADFPGIGPAHLRPFQSLPFLPSWPSLDHTHPFHIRRETVIEIRCYFPGNLETHHPHLRQVHRSFEQVPAPPISTASGDMLWFVEDILLPHLQSPLTHAILVLYPITNRNTNIFPIQIVQPPPAAFAGPILPAPVPQRFCAVEVVKEVPKTVAKLDRSIRLVGAYPVQEEQINRFVPIRSSQGYPPQKG